ncbi:sucrase ferredoxin [Nocardiopsis alborubida]|uniref:Sucrase ferredoxin n=1 Tax=Nocardiopsis alborubida TaxID=146802 RepID=A0A7X6RTG2_9ACTN|nr:sucrase ferredoxin [Nocardiopsis alborubida]NKZ02056.1 sucrase ferredoxin [Nocardiopsis alborubida]
MRLPTAPDGSRGCSALARYTGEQITATAGRTTGWLLIEHNGPWRNPAFTSPGLDPATISRLAQHLTGHDIKPQLIKRPGDHTRTQPTTRRAYLAHVSRTHPWVRRIDFTDPAQLLAYDLTAAEHPHPPTFGTPVDHTLYLVCTHAKKDPCCAILGRPVAAALTGGRAQVWETTHVGGDRFAANLVALPHGLYFGRLDPATAVRTVDALERGLVLPHNYRGRCSDSNAVQAAEAALRTRLGTTGVDAITHLDEQHSPDGTRVTLGHDGGLYTVSVTTEQGPPCPATCSAPTPSRPLHHRVTEIRHAPAPSHT